MSNTPRSDEHEVKVSIENQLQVLDKGVDLCLELAAEIRSVLEVSEAEGEENAGEQPMEPIGGIVGKRVDYIHSLQRGATNLQSDLRKICQGVRHI